MTGFHVGMEKAALPRSVTPAINQNKKVLLIEGLA
jgi:hypothetical protein